MTLSKPCLMSQDWIRSTLREVISVPDQDVKIEKNLLKGILSELYVLRGSLKEVEANRIAMVQSLTMQCSLVWMLDLVNEVMQSDHGMMSTDEILQMLYYHIDFRLKEIVSSESELVGGTA